ncbi:MAG: hypothetical protein ACR2NS_03255 [Gemmatimonadaceae bacterium]
MSEILRFERVVASSQAISMARTTTSRQHSQTLPTAELTPYLKNTENNPKLAVAREGVVATMAKHNPPGGERSKVRMLYVEGEFAQGEIQAIAMTFARQLPVRPPQKRIGSPSGEDGVLDTDREVEIEVEEESTFEDNGAAASATPKAPRGKRTYPTPGPVDVELDGGDKPFITFASEKKPGTHLDKYLVVADWLRAYRNTPTVTAGHVRTCYICADWTFDVQDPSQPFRSLKKDGLGSIAGGKFTINHLGTAAVKKMNSDTNG